jgi:acetate kinase
MYLWRTAQMSVDEIEAMLNRRSGVLGQERRDLLAHALMRRSGKPYRRICHRSAISRSMA